MTTDPPTPSSSQRDAFVRELVSALCDLGVEKIDPAAAKPGNGSRPTSLLTDQHRARSSASVTPFSSSSLRLARAAHARLQFDHPSLDATAVDALSKAVLELKFVDKIDQRNIALAPTRKLVAALAGDPPSLALPAGDESGGDEAGEADEDKARARALDAAAASSGCWDRLAVSYTVKMVLSVLESLPRPSSCSSSSSTSEAKGPGSSPPPPSALSPLLLLSRLAAELDEEGERAEEELARRAAAAAAGGGAGGEEAERALAAFLGQHDEEKEEGEGEASDAAAAAAAALEPGERTGEAESDDDSDYDTPLHQEAAAGRGAPVGDGVDPLSAVAAGEDDDDDSAPSSLLAAPPSLPSAVRAMVSLVQAARSRVGRGWGEAGGIELTAACLVAVRRAAAADSEASPPLRRLGTELLLLARDGAVASPLRGAAALPTLLEALGGASSGGSDDDGAPRAPAALADAAELFAAVVAGWPLPSPSSSSSFASSSSESRLALARAWNDSTTGAAGRTTNLLESLAAALLAATGGGSLEGAKRALAELNGDDDSSPPSSSSPPPSSSSSSSSSYLLGAACSALAALLMASQAAGASAEEVAGGMLGSGAWRSVACLLGAAAASPPGGDVVDDVDDENGGRTRLLPLPRGALEAALLGSASSPELSRYLAASPAGKFVVVEAAKIEEGGSGGVEGAMLSALFAATSSASEQKNSPFSSALLARMISASYMEEREVPKGSPSVRWRESARLLREMSRVAGGGGGGGHRWGAEVDAAVASLERALISAAAASSADSEVEVEERIVPAGEEAKKSPEAAHRREALRLASAERRRAAAAAAGVAAASPPSSFYAAAAASAAAPAVTRGKDD